MKRTVVLVAIAALCTAVAVSEAQRRPPLEPQVDQIIVKLEGNVPWKTTGIVLRESDRVEFKATGHVCFSNGHPDSCVNPAGYAREHYHSDFPGDWELCGGPMGAAFSGWEGHAGLLAKDDYGMHFVGTDRAMTGRKGPLSIGINDCTFTGDYFNTGSYSVVIKVVRGGQQ